MLRERSDGRDAVLCRELRAASPLSAVEPVRGGVERSGRTSPREGVERDDGFSGARRGGGGSGRPHPGGPASGPGRPGTSGRAGGGTGGTGRPGGAVRGRGCCDGGPCRLARGAGP
ncbi:hypothetical protein GCM10010472_46510 [Pseudonocardia halophobica]|uniref:Uncharacterized protein n=1 Tax=Pseudonocardia halophobica TaxID=29401 RepID=A0A9W6NXW6_9PSEU|nr:hypothetical protein GCM10017577_42490 [Pseudonocardia halophobica]